MLHAAANSALLAAAFGVCSGWLGENHLMTYAIAQAGNTVIPAILALEGLGYSLSVEGSMMVATAGGHRFVADDPVGLLGLVKLVEIRGWSWQATDDQIGDTMERYGWTSRAGD